MTFTPQLSFSKHVKRIISKANSRIPLLFKKLYLYKLPLDLVIKVFNCFIEPLFLYGLPIWSSNISNSSVSAINAVLTKFLKRYMCAPLSSNNSILYSITDTLPLFNSLAGKRDNFSNIILPSQFSGHKLVFHDFKHSLPSIFPGLPDFYWFKEIITFIPSNFPLRRKISVYIFNLPEFY